MIYKNWCFVSCVVFCWGMNAMNRPVSLARDRVKKKEAALFFAAFGQKTPKKKKKNPTLKTITEGSVLG